MSDIQQARDVLARRRAGTTARQGVGLPVTAAPADAALIQLVVNPELLDALDRMLARAIGMSVISPSETIVVHAHSIAAAIIDVDERMSA